MSKPTPIIIETPDGNHHGQVSTDGVLQIHIFQPAQPHQPPLFAVYPDGEIERAKAEIAQVLAGETLPADSQIKLPGAIAAGTGSRVRDVRFGTPKVAECSDCTMQRK